MWFWRSFQYLPPPSFAGVAPHLAVFFVYWAFRDLSVHAGPFALLPLGMAVCCGMVLTLSRGFAGMLAKARRGGITGPIIAFAVLFFTLAVAASVAPVDRVVQMGWVIATLIYAALLTFSVMIFTPKELARLPFRWASEHPTAQSAMWLTAIRYSAVVAGASAIMVFGTVEDWVLFITFGRLAIWYFFDWVIILTIMTAPDEEP